MHYKKSQNIISSIIIFSIMLGFIFGIISGTKQAKALDGGGSWQVAIKELILDSVSSVISNLILKPMQQKIQNWGMGRTSDKNEPFFVLDWGEFFNEVKNVASAKFIQDFNLTPLCGPLKFALSDQLGINLPYGDRPIYSGMYGYGACTLDTVIDNVDEFFKNPSLVAYGWDAWTALGQPNNNILGSYLMAQEEKKRMEEEELAAKDKETAVSSGTKNQTICNQTDKEACEKNCALYGPPSPDCLATCEMSIGACVEETVKNLGKDINTQVNNAMGSDMQKIINADEISKLVGIFFSALLNKAIDGMGLVPSQKSTTTPAQTAREETEDRYGYQASSIKPITSEQKRDVSTQILTGILKGVQMLSRSTTNCKDEDEMMNDLEYGKNVQQSSAAQVEALYVGMTGVGLQPDFEVLDPRFAPFTYFGHGYSQIPANKYPSKCTKILLNPATKVPEYRTCQQIISGLEPPTPTLTDLKNTNPKTEWTTNPPAGSVCTQCMYDDGAFNCPPAPYPPQPYPKSGDPYAKVTNRKADFYNACRGTYMNTTLTRCDDCIKKADEKCNQDNLTQKNNCIKSVCSNYGGIKTKVTPQDGLDFYNRCMIEEKKGACFTCLKEYFIPASYCEIIKDYTARAITKYPAALLRVSDNDGHFVGPYDSSFDSAYGGDDTECDNDQNAHKAISIDLICRIMPDYRYEGEKICNRCFKNTKDVMTQAELNDITDFRPHGADCENQTIPIGGKINVWNLINDSIFNDRGKCCAATWAHDSEKYSLCIGSAESSNDDGDGTDGEATACKEGEVELAYIKTTMGGLLNCPDGNSCYQGKAATSDKCRRGCSSIQFKVPDMGNIDAVDVRTNPAPGGSIVTVATSACTGGNNYVGREPTNPICQMEAKNTRGAESCCTNAPGNAPIGKDSMTCNLSNFVGRTLTLSVTSDDLSDCKTTAYICVPQ